MNTPVSARRPAGRRRDANKAKARALTEFRCESILAAARVVFARHGFAATTVDLIAAEAGVAKGTLYLYYPSKAAIYSAAVIEGIQQLAAETIASLATDVPIRDKLHRLLEMRLRFFAERADFYRMYKAELGMIGQAAVQIRREYLRLFEEQVARLTFELEQAVGAGTLRTINCRQVAMAVLDLSYGLTQRRLDTGADAVHEDVEELVQVLWRGIRK